MMTAPGVLPIHIALARQAVPINAPTHLIAVMIFEAEGNTRSLPSTFVVSFDEAEYVHRRLLKR
jgi:hypothetical protein